MQHKIMMFSLTALLLLLLVAGLIRAYQTWSGSNANTTDKVLASLTAAAPRLV